ncbi:MAG TPA: AsmA-like C-terminal region-containing protein, partial [Alphaproteobacteria bacterium]|nr:AsmA-like C-terminal region-containing protein [Alphaproteobacteria bacterium]
ARLDQGRIALDEARALLPGGSEVTVVAALEPAGERSWRWSGRLTAASDNLRGVLQWLGAEPAGVPADRLRKLSLKARLSGAGSNLQVSEIDAQLDGSHITGGIAAVLRARPGLGIGLSIDEVNLDAYLPRDGAPGQPEEPAKTESLFGRLDANFNLALGSLTYGGQRLQSLRAEGTLQNGNLDLKQLAAQTPSGGNARLAGRVGAIASKEPDINLDFDLSARNGAELIQLAGLPEAKQRIGSMSISGTAVGKPGAVKVDLAVVAAELQAEAKVVGAVAAFRPSLLGSGKVKAELREPAKLAGLLQIEPARLAGFGPVSIEGELGRDGTNLSVDLTLTAAEAGLTAQLAGARAGPGKDASLEGRLELSAENGRPVLLALGIDPTRAPSGPVSARLTASGPVRDLAVDGEAQAAEIRASLRGRVGFEERRSYQLEVTAAHPDLPRLASLFGIEAIPLPGELKLQGTLAGSDERLALALDRSQFGPLSASGQGEIEFKDPRPRVKLALSLGELPLPALLAPFRARAKDQTIGAGWSTRAVGWSALTRLDAEATISAERAVAGRVRIDAPKVELVLEEGRLALRKFEGEIAKGTWSATGAIVPAGRDTVALTLSVKGAEIGQTPDWAGLSLTRGRLELGLDLTSRGASAVELVQGLAGGGRLRIEDGSLRGVDLTKLSKLPAPEPGDPAPDASAITGALADETAFDALEAAIAVERGVIRTADLAAMAPAATLHGALSLDLLKWQTEGAFEARSVERPELPALEIAIAGPLDDPQLEMDASALAAALTPAPEPEPQIEPAPAPASEPSAPQPAPAPQPEPAAEQPAPEPQPAPAPPAQPPQPPAPAPAPKAEPGADAFVKGILEKLKKPQQP